MKIFCAVNLHEWEVLKSVQKNTIKTVIKYVRVCKRCGKRSSFGAYEYFTSSELNSIIKQISLN